MKKPLAGFTIVELVVVIAVVGILAAVTTVSYRGVQSEARDTAIKNATQQTADALQLWSTRKNLPPTATGGGYGSTATGGGNGTGWVNEGGYGSNLDIEEVLRNDGYLPPSFSSGLSTAERTSSHVMMFYACSGGRYAVYASLNDDTDRLNQRTKAVQASCNLVPFDNYSMDYVVIF